MNDFEEQLDAEIQRRLNDPVFLQEKLLLVLEENKRLVETIQSKEDEMNERGILEFAKATGQVEIAPGYKLFTREYFTKGRFVDFDSTHRVQVMKEGMFQHPFIFVAAGEVSGGQPDIAECESEENAILAIGIILASA